MLPKPSILETHFGKYMVWPNDIALFNRLMDTHLRGIDEIIVQLSKTFIEEIQNKIILDIGANVGSFTIPLALKFPEAKFYCFEVQRIVYYQLCGNIFLNSLDNVFAHNLAMGRTKGNFDIPIVSNYSKVANVGGYSIDDFSMQNPRPDFCESLLDITHKDKIFMQSLDSMTELPLAGLIKIDVEGYELEVLRGSVNYIKKSGYPPIFFEAWDYDWYKEKKNILFSFLNSIGYENIYSPSGDNNYLAQNLDAVNDVSVFLTFDEINSNTPKIRRHVKKKL